MKNILRKGISSILFFLTKKYWHANIFDCNKKVMNMKNLIINKEKIISLLLTGTIALSMSGCAKQAGEKKENIPETTPIPISDDIIYDRDTLFYHQLLTSYEYESVNGDNKYTLHYGDNIYFVEGDIITNKFVTTDELEVTLISSQLNYALVILSDGQNAYVDISSLKTVDYEGIKSGNYTVIEDNKEKMINKNTFLYDSSGMVTGHLYENQTCNAVATNGGYTLITLPDETSGFVLSNSLIDNYKKIMGYGFINKGTNLYWDSNFTQLAYTTSENQEIFYVDFINQEYAGIFDRDGRELMYVKLSQLDANFIDIDLTEQQMDCYLNYQLVASYPTRSGKLVTPTHEGTFDIDEKVEGFSFPKYPGCYAKHWIVYNEENEEGIHDLVGDDEQNYGNYAYQLYGSHGCVRVPAEASEFVYDNYEVGDMVLVRKK